MFRHLYPSKQRGNKKRLFGFDIETHGKYNRFLCASVYDVQEDTHQTFYDKKDCIKYFKEKKFRNSYIAATNLGFDFFGLFRHSKEEKGFRPVFRASSLICTSSYLFKDGFYQKSRKGNSISKHKVTFIDTMNYSCLSVKKIGEIIGNSKMDTPDFLGKKPKNKHQWDILTHYNRIDAEISGKYIKFLFDAFYELGATPKMTIASTSMSLFRNKYLKSPIYQKSEEVLLDHFKAYYGGRTEAFKRGLIIGLNYYDVNSMYPSVMRNEYPDPNSMRISHMNTLDKINGFEGISDVDVYCPKMDIPFLPLRYKNKLIFPYGNFSGWYSHVELRKALELGYTIKKVRKTYWYKRTFHPFRDYVNDIYSKRMEYKKQKSPMEYVCKILMNSLYGKFGQRFESVDNWMPFADVDKDFFDENPKYEIINDYIKSKKKGAPRVFCFPIFSLYTTAYARCLLYDYLMPGHTYYCDTDSIITDLKFPESPELGKMKLEHKIDNGIIVKPKLYDIDGNVKAKGVGMKIDSSGFMVMLKDKEIKYQKFLKFKESLRKSLDPNIKIDVIKKLNIEDDKRLWPSDFNPLKLQDSEPINMDVIWEAERLLKDKKEKALHQRAMDDYQKTQNKVLKAFINSDKFDKKSVGWDISSEEFIENEKDFKTES